MNKREAAMLKLQGAKFALWELHLYLDTHPEDEKAYLDMYLEDLESIAAYKRYAAKYAMMKHEYEEQYGPIGTLDAPGVAWLKNPWPWDSEVRD